LLDPAELDASDSREFAARVLVAAASRETDSHPGTFDVAANGNGDKSEGPLFLR
jgi:hypothetical protein